MPLAAWTLRVRPVAVLVAVIWASVAGAESTVIWPRMVAEVLCAMTAGAAMARQLARAQASSLRDGCRGIERGNLEFICFLSPKACRTTWNRLQRTHTRN